MNLIDISSWQRGIDLSSLFAQNPLHGVIVKATQGLTYVNPTFKQWADWLVKNGKPLGFYHYLDVYGAQAEARHFVDTIRPYIGKGILAIDYEGNTLRLGAGYLKQCLDEVYKLTGIKAFVYVSQSFIATQDFKAIAEAGYPLWMAQYATTNPVHGFQDNPWQKGSYAPFDKFLILQYSGNGRLAGWDVKNNALDLDKFYGSYAMWMEIAKGEWDAPVPSQLKKADPSIVLDVLKGKYGIEASTPSRSSRLREAGYDPDSVQAKINQLYGIANKVKRDIGNEMPYLNAILWIARS